MKFIKRLFDFSLVRWVKNKDIKHHREDSYYMLVVTTDGNQYLFTKEQVASAKERALKNPEDTLENAEFIT